MGCVSPYILQLRLFDNTVWKMPSEVFTAEERMRSNWLATSLVALAHGIPFFHAGACWMAV